MTEPHLRLGAAACCRLLKLLRDKPLKQADISEALGYPRWTTERWLDVLVAEGLVRRVRGFNGRTTGGQQPYVYSLAPEWGGKEC